MSSCHSSKHHDDRHMWPQSRTGGHNGSLQTLRQNFLELHPPAALQTHSSVPHDLHPYPPTTRHEIHIKSLHLLLLQTHPLVLQGCNQPPHQHQPPPTHQGRGRCPAPAH